jgi:hypothetical protein
LLVLASIGQPLCPKEFNSYLLAGLDKDYDAFADRVSARPIHDLMPMRDVFSQLLNTEQQFKSRSADLVADVHMAHYTNRPSGGGHPTQQQYRTPGLPQGLPSLCPRMRNNLVRVTLIKMVAHDRFAPPAALVARAQRVKYAPKLVMLPLAASNGSRKLFGC